MKILDVVMVSMLNVGVVFLLLLLVDCVVGLYVSLFASVVVRECFLCNLGLYFMMMNVV